MREVNGGYVDERCSVGEDVIKNREEKRENVWGTDSACLARKVQDKEN